MPDTELLCQVILERLDKEIGSETGVDVVRICLGEVLAVDENT
jgi:hypothetical protein